MSGSDHLGDRVAALVDGQLDHPSRERLLAHLAHCAPCRTQVEAQRRLKASLRELGARPMLPSDELTARLLALPSQPLSAGRDRGPLPPSLPRGPRRPAGRPGTRRPGAGPGTLRRRGAAAGALVALGLVSALALGQPTAEGPSVPVDPASDVFVADFVTSTTDLQRPAFARMVPSWPSSGR
jgi:anti-sigma factor RsiW